MQASKRILSSGFVLLCMTVLLLAQPPGDARSQPPVRPDPNVSKSPSDRPTTVLPETIIQGRARPNDDPDSIWLEGSLSEQGGPLLSAGRRSLRNLLNDPLHLSLIHI